MAKENAMNGQKDAKSANDLRYRLCWEICTYVLLLFSLQHPWEVTSTSAFTRTCSTNLGAFRFLSSFSTHSVLTSLSIMAHSPFE